MGVKGVLKVLAFIIVLVLATYLIFVEWLPNIRRGIEVEGGGLANSPYADKNPEAIKKEDDWIILKSTQYYEGGSHHAALFLDYPETPKHIKMIWLVSGGSWEEGKFGTGIDFSIATIPKDFSGFKVPENATVDMLPGIEQPRYKNTPFLKPGKYEIELFINEKGFIEKLRINGKDIVAEEMYQFTPARFPPKGMWRVQIGFYDFQAEFTIAVKIVEVRF